MAGLPRLPRLPRERAAQVRLPRVQRDRHDVPRLLVETSEGVEAVPDFLMKSKQASTLTQGLSSPGRSSSELCRPPFNFTFAFHVGIICQFPHCLLDRTRYFVNLAGYLILAPCLHDVLLCRRKKFRASLLPCLGRRRRPDAKILSIRRLFIVANARG